jgi:site-specific recombinase XerD
MSGLEPPVLFDDRVADVTRFDIVDFLSALADQQLSGVTRAGKPASLREYFRFLVNEAALPKAPTAGIETPKRERLSRSCLDIAEYNKMLALAGSRPRDHAILQVFLQTGVRVSELRGLRQNDLDLRNGYLTVTKGKGMKAREIPLEKKGIQALKNYLTSRGQSPCEQLFLNYLGEPIGERGVRKLVVKYKQLAGITKKGSCHSLRHTFASYKAECGLTPFQLQELLGHENINTTQFYVHNRRQHTKKMMEATSL